MLKDQNLKNIEEYNKIKQKIVGIFEEIDRNKLFKLQKYIESKKETIGQ